MTNYNDTNTIRDREARRAGAISRAEAYLATLDPATVAEARRTISDDPRELASELGAPKSEAALAADRAFEADFKSLTVGSLVYDSAERAAAIRDCLRAAGLPLDPETKAAREAIRRAGLQRYA